MMAANPAVAMAAVVGISVLGADFIQDFVNLKEGLDDEAATHSAILALARREEGRHLLDQIRTMEDSEYQRLSQ